MGKSDQSKKARKEKKKDERNRGRRAGLAFPVGKLFRYMRHEQPTSKLAAVYATAALEAMGIETLAVAHRDYTRLRKPLRPGTELRCVTIDDVKRVVQARPTLRAFVGLRRAPPRPIGGTLTFAKKSFKDDADAQPAAAAAASDA